MGRNLTASTGYDAFGNATTTNFPSRYQFTGREYDNFTGLHHYRARFYDGNLGRFISEDPIGFAGGDVNLYGYVGNNPMNFIDPSGLQIDPTQVRNCDAKCQEDINKMNQIHNQTVGDLTANNRRLPTTGTFGGEVNNAYSSLYYVINNLGTFGPIYQAIQGTTQLYEFEGCIFQSDQLRRKLSLTDY